MALSTVAWAVIMTICGRSLSALPATSSRMTSRPVMSDIRLSMTRTSNDCAAIAFCAARPPGASVTRWPSARSARPTVFLIFSSSSTRRMEPVAVMSHSAAGLMPAAEAAGRDRLSSRARRTCTAIVPPRPSTMLRAMGSPRPVPDRLVVKYGSKICATWSAAMPPPRSLIVTLSARSSRISLNHHIIAGGRQRRAFLLGLAPASRDCLTRVGQQVDQRRTQTLSVRDDLERLGAG